MHRYRATRSWTVGALAAAAAAFALLVSGGVSAGFDAAEGLGPRLARTFQSAPFVIEAKAATRASADGAIPAVRPVAASAAATGWQIQIGALRSPGAAEALLAAVAGEVPELGNLPRSAQAKGKVTRARLTGIADETAALGLCAKLSRAGRACFVVPPPI